LRKHRFYIFVIAALAVVGFVFHGSAAAHTGNAAPAGLGVGDLAGSDAGSPTLNGYSVALASLSVPIQAQQQQATQAQQAAQQQAAQQQAAQQQAAQQQAAQLQAAQQQAAQLQAAQALAAQQDAQHQAAQQQQAAQAQQVAQQQQAAQSVPAPVATSSSGDDFARLRQCESGGDYSDNTGNGYYGAYQFSESAWQGLGYSGLPSDASPAQQDQAAQQLHAQSGWGPWPSCSAQLGLN
jgi:flagellar biosynthesis GTPase FlhF